MEKKVTSLFEIDFKMGPESSCTHYFHISADDDKERMVIKRQIIAYLNVCEEIKKSSYNSDFQNIFNLVRKEILAWTPAEELLTPVKDYVADCRQFMRTVDLNTKISDIYEIVAIRERKTITTYETETIL